MAAEMENLMDVYRCLVPDDDDFVNSVVMEYLLPELPESKLIEESDKYLRKQSLKISPQKETLSTNLHQSVSMTSTTSNPPIEDSKSAKLTGALSSVDSMVTVSGVKALKIKSEEKGDRGPQSSHDMSAEERELKRARLDENAIEIFAKVVDVLCQQQSFSPISMSPSCVPVTKLSIPKVSEVTNTKEINLVNSNMFICRTCGERTTDRICTWSRVGILPGPYTASALKYLNGISNDFSPESLFRDHVSKGLLELKSHEIEIPSLAHMKNLEENLRVVLIGRLKFTGEQI